MGVIDRLRGLVTRGKNGPINWTREGGMPVSWPMEWFQMGYSPMAGTSSSTVEACISSYSQTIAQLPGRHYRREEDGTQIILYDTAPARILNRPNDYQTLSDFLLNLVQHLLATGNAYWIGDSDLKSATSALYLLDPNQTNARRVVETGDVFYETGGLWAEMLPDDLRFEGRALIPSRFVGHVRLHTPDDPLIGVTPLQAAQASVAANNAITNHQASFFSNMSRPSGVLSTDLELSKDQMTQLREAWADHSKGLNSGGVPILANGLKWQALSVTSQDAQLVEAWKMSIEDITRVFRIPPMLVGNMENSTFNNAESLMSFWLASGLGFTVNHIEEAMKLFFRLPPNQKIELDTEVLLRTDLQARMEALGTGVTKGLLAPNEARKKLGYGPVEGGDMPRVQAQMIPLNTESGVNFVGDEPAPAPAPDEPEPDEDEDDLDDQERAMLPYLVGAKLRELRNAA